MVPEYIEASTKSGKLKGLVVKSEGITKKTYYSFQGIPYAKPPVGTLRFKAPVPFGPWKGVQDATREGNDCVQRHMIFKHNAGNEDCLFLNIYTTQEPNKGADRKAVMVWIHGGGFATGSGSSELYGPDFLIEEDIVLVTINYRCGVFGFLSLENDKVPGNAGLKDQSLALQWIQDHIDSFGGDPNNVTIFGESAGGASVNYHLLSPLSKGLFHKAILQSGSSLCQWAFQDKPREKAFLLAKELGCTSQDSDIILEFLLMVPDNKLLEAQGKEILISDKEKIHKFSLSFLPCIEVTGDTPFLIDHPRKMMEEQEFAKVPIIIGVTDKEGLLAIVLKEINCQKVNENLSLLVPLDLKITKDSEEERRLGKDILQFYTKKDFLSWDVIDGYVDFISDIGFSFAVNISRQYFLKHNTAPVFTYQFSYISPRCYSAFMIPMAYPEEGTQFLSSGAGHGDELIHLFKSNFPQAPFIPPSPDDQVFMNKFLKAWTTFAKNGDPNCKELEVEWKPDSIQDPHFLDLGKVYKAVDGTLFPKRMDFWEKMYGNTEVCTK